MLVISIYCIDILILAAYIVGILLFCATNDLLGHSTKILSWSLINKESKNLGLLLFGCAIFKFSVFETLK